ncbi:SusC/RagA family TonB-linked outer membrane protein [Carboxylicivirga sediminis]|uniref:SusC/RagA family TonB-linked outer membrane protein n=1 Tax=Carboxylicivirga sediminis TaxID=2006564 RepID=A0A941IWV5_9BACT|nr:SusC/RagA family TonB-linked outer membrane protein [Carboxylicivirga sediminis]MBR8535545.1 SusC/RagA family TonB-linked outer membrane protein [Carboxylicivirga sediminis]
MKKLFLCRFIQLMNEHWKRFVPFRMALLIAILLFSSLSAHANLQHKVTILKNKLTLEELFNEVKNQTGLTVIYSNDRLNKNEQVELTKTSFEVDDLLNYVLENKSLAIEFRDDYIIVKPSNRFNTNAQQQQHIKGTVVDEDGLPLPGVSVIFKGTQIGTATGFEGEFDLVVPEGSTTIVVSFIGMITQEINIQKQTEIRVQLKTEASDIDEVVVTGYQKVDRKLFTGAATRISAEEAKIDGMVDVGRMIEGKAAGVSVQNVSGSFGAAPKIRVRGAASIFGDQKPLWVVNGVVLEDVVDISPDELSSGDAETLISSSVAGINSDDIESFQILKDASATALYGARAMNGVIVITTKQGTQGKPRINITTEFTTRLKPNYVDYDIMNSQDQMSVFRELESKGSFNHADIIRGQHGGVYYKMYEQINTYNPATGKYNLANTTEARAKYLQQYEMANTDWFDELFKTSVAQNYSLSISSGNETSRYYVSTSFYNDPGWTVADDVKRYTTRLRGDFDITDKLTVGISTSGSIREQSAPGTFDRVEDVVNGGVNRDFDINPFSYALNTSRTMRARDENGNLEYYRRNWAPFNIHNEIASNSINFTVLDLDIQGELGYKLNKHLEYKFIGSVRYAMSTQEHKINENANVAEAYRAAGEYTIREANKFLYKDPEDPNALKQVVLPKGGFYNRVDNKLVNYYIRNTINYNNTFNDIHSFNWLSGQETRYADRKESFSNGYGYQWNRGGIPFTDYRILKQNIQGGFPYYGMSESYDRFVAFFTNLAYSYKGKYTLGVTARMDGSNQLGKSRSSRWLPTWNISGKWNLKEEAFLQDNNLISFLAIRGTYGLVGSMGPARNSSLILKNGVTFRPYQSEIEPYMYISDLENSELTWEKLYEANIGIDVGFLNNRISLETDFYKRNSFDLIAWIKTSGIGGEAWKLANYADMESKGLEFSLGTKNVKLSNFSWDTNLTFAYNENEITNLQSKPSVYDLIRAEGGALEGYPVRSLFSIPFAGLNESGLPQFYDENGDVVVQDIYFQGQDVDFLKYEGQIDPKITGGFGNVFNYKNLRLNVFMTYQFGNVIRLYPSFKAGYSDWNAMTNDMKDRWVVPGDENITTVPALVHDRVLSEETNLNRAYNSYNYSDQRVAKGDFIRLKEVSLAYNLPKKTLQSIGFKSAQLKLQATNLFLLYSDSKLNGQDPEFFGSGGVALPVPRQFTFTVKLGI